MNRARQQDEATRAAVSTVCVLGTTAHSPSIERYTRELAQALGERLTVVSPELKERRAFAAKLVDRYLRFGLLARNTKADRFIITSESYAYLLRYLDPEQCLVVCHDLHPLTLPCVPWRARLAYRASLAALPRARAVVAVSQHTRRALLTCLPRLKPEQVHVVHNGLSSFWRPTPNPEERKRLGIGGDPFVLSVGSAGSYKNIDGLVDAMVALFAERPVTLVRVGPLRKSHLDLFAHFPNRCIQLRNPSDETLRVLYSEAAVLGFPSWSEGFGWPVLEAMACGCPVVCSNRTSLPEVAGDAALLVDPAEPGALIRALGQVLDDPALSARLSEKGSTRAQAFSWSRAAQEILQCVA